MYILSSIFNLYSVPTAKKRWLKDKKKQQCKCYSFYLPALIFAAVLLLLQYQKEGEGPIFWIGFVISGIIALITALSFSDAYDYNYVNVEHLKKILGQINDDRSNGKIDEGGYPCFLNQEIRNLESLIKWHEEGKA